MHIQVSHINTGEVGDGAEFEVAGENPDIPDLELTQPISGRVRVTKLDDGLRVKGNVQLAFELECYRCLDLYVYQTEVPLEALFREAPEEDEWPISAKGEIDLAPLVRQETLVAIPIQQLCQDDCAGLCMTCGLKNTDGHVHETEETVRQPRITTSMGPSTGSGNKKRG